MAADIVTGDASVGTDTLRSIEQVRVRGMDGNDQLTGNGNTAIVACQLAPG